MSGTTIRGFAVLLVLTASGCATTRAPSPAESLLDGTSGIPRATLSTCAAANMALVCEGASTGRIRGSGLDRQCQCADRRELTMMGATRR